MTSESGLFTPGSINLYCLISAPVGLPIPLDAHSDEAREIKALTLQFETLPTYLREYLYLENLLEEVFLKRITKKLAFLVRPPPVLFRFSGN